jgi:glycosyltransferase involved in cell wall biosynthesis
MSKCRLLFLVNDSASGISAIRTRKFAERLSPKWEILIEYRGASKIKSVFLFLQSALRFKPDIIYVMDAAFSGVLAGNAARKLLGCKVVTDTGDVTYELAKSSGRYSSTQIRLIQWVEQLALSSDHLIVRGSYHKSWLKEQGTHNVTFVPDGVETGSIHLSPVTKAKETLDMSNSMVVGLVGSMGWSEKHQMCYGWDIVEALALLKNDGVKAILVGDGNGRKILEERAEKLGVKHQILFAGFIPYAELPLYLSAMDICISTQSNDLVGMVRTTGKLPLYLAYGKYVIATAVGEAKCVLPGIGSLLPYQGVRDNDHPHRLALELKKILENPHLLKVSHQAVKVARENFDYDILTKRIETVCTNLMTSECP